mmetsp:Transcript_11477/g.14367  ORF Transcript_11477/g.14367 Transcript_11477/m.14367 type:complete len:252 (-) Transcript_11477:48-803(-)
MYHIQLLEHKKKIEIDNENRLQVFYDKRMAEEVNGDDLGDEFKGYVFKITGGNDKDGFPMKQGVLQSKRVKLLLRKGMKCYRAGRKGERKRKAVRGCIVGPDIAVLSLVIVKRGEQDLVGLTDVEVPRRLGPKRYDKIQKMFNLTKDDDVRDYVVRRKVKTKSGKIIVKKPKIQRLITSTVLNRRRQEKLKVKKRKIASAKKRKDYFEELKNRKNAAKKAQDIIDLDDEKDDIVQKKKKSQKKKGKKKSKK